MEGLQINFNYQPKIQEVDKHLFNQMYMEYIQSLGGEDNEARPTSQVSNAVSNYGVKINSEQKQPSITSASSRASSTYNDQEDDEEHEQPKSNKSAD